MGKLVRWFDALLAVSVAAVSVADALLGSLTLAPLDYLLLLTGTLVLAVARAAPRTALVVAVVCMLGYGLRVSPGVTAAVPVLISLYFAVAAGHRLMALSVAGPFAAAGLAGSVASSAGQNLSEIAQGAILPIGWFVAATVAGEVSRHRRAYLEQAEQRAIEAERSREETALRRASEERLRIARELHDSLTHSISIIKVQAGVAVHLARKRGEDVPGALTAIQEASGEAMRELRATLEVLRDDNDEAGGRVGEVPVLVEWACSAGYPTTLTVVGEPRTLPVDVDRAVYRIVQEALTNVARHAGASGAEVGVHYLADEVVVQIDDSGTARAGTMPRPGNGLTGMRERVATLGGRLHTGPRPSGGFSVRAELPVGGS